jgi:hypothetical protein
MHLNSASHADGEVTKRSTSMRITTMLSNLSLGGGSKSAVGSPSSATPVGRSMSMNEEELNLKGLSRAKQVSAGSMKEEKKYTKSPKDLMSFFRIDSLGVFTGEVVNKKHSNDYFAKDTFAWVCVKTLTLHWSKFASIDKEAPSKSKYIRLKEQKHYPDAKLGVMIDTMTSVKLTSTGLVCYLQSKKAQMEFKMDSAASLNWFNVLSAMGVKSA